MRIDPRYTPTSAFDTFPWPDPTDEQRDGIGRLSAELVDLRLEICRERQIGLTTLYNEVDDGAGPTSANFTGGWTGPWPLRTAGR